MISRFQPGSPDCLCEPKSSSSSSESSFEPKTVVEVLGCAIDLFTNGPVVGATVSLLTSDGSSVIESKLTDADGKAYWPDLYAGNRFRVSASGFSTATGADSSAGSDPVTHSFFMDVRVLPGYYCCNSDCGNAINFCSSVELIDPLGDPLTLTNYAPGVDVEFGGLYYACKSYHLSSTPRSGCANPPDPISENVTVRYFAACFGLLSVDFLADPNQGDDWGTGSIVSRACVSNDPDPPTLSVGSCPPGGEIVTDDRSYVVPQATVSPCGSRKGGSASFQGALERPDGSGGEERHILSFLDGWGVTPTFTVNYCSEPLAMMAIPTAEPPLPSIARQATGLARSAAAVTRDLGRKVDGAELDRRLAICRACDHYRPSDGKCGKMTGCGCVVAAKARYRALHCPLKPPKW